MKSTRERRALAAVIRYELAAQAVKAMSAEIAAELTQCPIYQLAMEHQNGPQAAGLWDGNKVKTHLYHAYHETESDGFGERSLDKGGQEVYLTEDDTGCTHCLAAWHLIERRRAARKEFGLAKLAIRNIGKAALKEQPPLEQLAS